MADVGRNRLPTINFGQLLYQLNGPQRRLVRDLEKLIRKRVQSSYGTTFNRTYSIMLPWKIIIHGTENRQTDVSISTIPMPVRWGHPAPMSKFWLWQPPMVWPYVYLTHPNHCQTFFLNSWYPPFWFFNDCLYRFLCQNSVFSDFDPFSL